MRFSVHDAVRNVSSVEAEQQKQTPRRSSGRMLQEKLCGLRHSCSFRWSLSLVPFADPSHWSLFPNSRMQFTSYFTSNC